MVQAPVKQDRWTKPFLVVDLDATAIRVLEVSPSTQGPFLKWGATMVDRSNGRSFRQAASEGLQKLLTSNKITAKETRLLLSGPSTVTLPLDLPPLPAKEIPNAVRWSVVRAMPFPIADAVLDHHVLGAKPGDQEQTVLVAAVRRSTLNESLDILQSAGLSLVQVTVLPLALTGLLQALPVKGHETTLFLDLRPHLATLIFFHGRDLNLVRTLAAEEGSSQKAEAAAKGSLPRLIDEIWLSLAYYQERFSGEKIQRLLVAGSVQDLERVQSALSEAIGIPVEPVNLNAVLPMGKDEPLPSTLAAAAGILFDASKVNLLPHDVRYKKQRQVLRTGLRAAVAALFLGTAAWTGFELVSVRYKQRELAEQQAAWERVSSASEEVRRFQQMGASLSPTLSIYEEPAAFSRRWLGALKVLSSVTPPTVSLTALEADGVRGLKMKGLVFADADPPEVALSEFMANLSDSPYFGTVQLGSSQEQPGYPQRTLVFDLVVGWR
jgi:Tfp pilus assembly PilM family ATPase